TSLVQKKKFFSTCFYFFVSLSVCIGDNTTSLWVLGSSPRSRNGTIQWGTCRYRSPPSHHTTPGCTSSTSARLDRNSTRRLTIPRRLQPCSLRRRWWSERGPFSSAPVELRLVVAAGPTPPPSTFVSWFGAAGEQRLR
uniref:Uncharacterized protein n=1 Tax=Ciona savignyi TaxID=51511 RepID=H2Y685_CIOSA